MPTAFSERYSVSVTDDIETTGHVAYGRFVSGRIICRTYGGIVLTCYDCETRHGVYALCTDVGTAGVLASLAEDASVALPALLTGAMWLKFVGDGVGEIIVTLKGT